MSAHGVALVTGASQGIGRAIALRLADDGFDIAINDIPAAKENLDILSKEIVDKGRKVCIALGDVSDDASVANMVSTTVHNLGQLDVMVANAGICMAKPIIDTGVDEWDRIFSVNARGVFLCYKYAAAQMIKQGWGGRIIGASSVGGHRGGVNMAPYSASKFAVRGLTHSAAVEWGRHKITVNAYCPGAIETDMLKELGVAAGNVETYRKRLADSSALGYNGTPVEIASIVSYLASKEAHFITGSSMNVNGGLLLL